MTARNQIFDLLKNLKWMIAISLVISVGLYLPDQVRELYRISAGEGGLVLLKQLAAIAVIAAVIWFGAFQLTTATIPNLGNLGPTTGLVFGWTPIVIGVLPILAAAAGQYQARPGTSRLTAQEQDKLIEVGNIFRVQYNELQQDADLLIAVMILLLVIAAAFIVLTWLYGERVRVTAAKVNERYFDSYRFFFVSIALIAVLVAAFVWFPAGLAQGIGTFFIVALFTVCLVLMGVHVTIKTMQHRFPYFPVLLFFAFLFAWIGYNDNHRIRPAEDGQTAAPQRVSATRAFEDWISQPGRLTVGGQDEFPVFIVSAQGGGIYAAHNAATFLARMQDLCPGFRRHLFAISGVSGGSVGAAVFAAALHASDQDQKSQQAASGEACTKIAQFLASIRGVPGMYDTGPIEAKTDLALSGDFLSPLIAATLFPDFTQMFLPFAVPAFDRARALEHALESAADKMTLGQSDEKKINLLQENYASHWTPSNNMPALLLNTTDAGSGKRVVISPFDIDPTHRIDSDLCMFANVSRSAPDIGEPKVLASTSPSFRLSTAAFISARFPWITPAATVGLENPCITKGKAARLVDGGYVDNSGVETALDLLEQLKDAKGVKERKIRFYLLSLSGGDFPDRRAFSFNELMEPVRALLSVRTSRAYIALNRAAMRDKPAETPPPSATVSSFPSFNKNKLRDHFYDLPLGWSLSGKTREIISLGSGRFWDCEPSTTFSQSREHLSNADCLQIQIYHLLNGSTAAAFDWPRDLRKAEELLSKAKDNSKADKPELQHQALLACYERDWIQTRDKESYDRRVEEARKNAAPAALIAPYRKQYLAYFQSEQVKALLDEWKQLQEQNPRILAYMLGSISYDSGDFARRTERLTFGREEDLYPAWRKRIAAARELLAAEGKPVPEVAEILKNPRILANIVWGYEGNYFRNNQPDDGWNYRPRGMYQIVGRWEFDQTNGFLKKLYPGLGIDILQHPDTLWHRRMSAKVAFAHFSFSRRYTLPGGEKPTLVEMINSGLSYKDIRARQTDMAHQPPHPDRVAQRAQMFEKCIAEAQVTPVSQSPVGKTMEKLKAIAIRLAGFDYDAAQ